VDVFRLAAICFLFSGATALIYEVLWARMLGLVFGATTIAVSAVLAAFMGGLAAGSAVGGTLAKRIRNPLCAYALIEIGIGLYALMVPWLFRQIDRVYALIWERFHPGFYGFAGSRFALAALVLFAPTALMGATLPVLVAAVQSAGERRASIVAKLYTLNLAGAIAGTIAAGFLLLPAFGVRATIWIAATGNLLIGALVLLSGARISRSREMRDAPVKVDQAAQVSRPAFWFACVFVSGLVTISMQIVWSRLLSMIIGSSTYAFTIVVALFLIGLALGAWFVSSRSNNDPSALRRSILLVQLLTVVTLFISLRLTNVVPSMLVQTGLRIGIDSWAGLLALQVAAATLLVLSPAVLMGMIMPLVLTWAGRGTNESDLANYSSPRRVGQSYALNTLGAITGAILTAFVLIPLTSTRFTIFCMASLSLVIAGVAYEPRSPTFDRGLARSLAAGVSVALILAMLFLWPRINLNALSTGAYDSFVRVLAKSRSGVPEAERADSPSDHQLLMFEEGRTATVSVRKDWGITSMAINGRTNGSDADDMATQVLAGQLGVLVAPRTEKILMIGFATGVSAGSVLQSPAGSVECVEIEPAAVTSSRYFEHVNNRPLNDPRLRVVLDDARTVLRVNPVRYDLIISEPSHPWVPGVANLFTREFFTLGRERLTDEGIFVQWLQIYQLSTESVRSVLATFADVYPHVSVFRVQGAAKGKDLILLGSRAPIDLKRIDERMQEPRTLADLSRVGLNTPADLRAWFVCNENQLKPAVAGAVINTDDNMHVETVAPREAFRSTMEQNAAWIESLRKR
jgi:spermidine synthase